MVAVRLSALVNEKHQLIVTLPDDLPVGPVELVLQPVKTLSSTLHILILSFLLRESS